MEGRSPGQQLGRYQQVATLGQGGMGTVYLALASGFGQFRKLLVVKELRQDLTRQKGFIHLFMDEAKLAARLSHPNVVQTFEAFRDEDRYLLAMEYLDGQPLNALIRRLAGEATRELPLVLHIHILCEILSGLHYAHELRDYDGSRLRVVHRDISPQNVFLTYHGEVKVVDFGVAKAANAATSTAPGVFVGKFAYAAPEQILGRPVDARTDVFAVGVMLWQAISQRRFSVASPTPEAFRGRAKGVEPRIRAIVPHVDLELAAICDRALEVDPDKRFPTAQAFRDALQTYLEARNVRIHDSDLANLMQSVFEQERAALHAQIEAAVQASGTQSNVEPLSFLGGDKEQTAVADLSNLVDVSAQLEDGYSNTKVTRAPSQATHSAPIATTAASSKRALWWALSACVVVALCGALWLSMSAREQPAALPRPLAPAIVTALRVQQVQAQPAAIAAPAPAISKVRASEPRRPLAAAKPATRRAKPPARPGNEATTQTGPAKPTRVEAGGDLGIHRRAAPDRIDSENPYQ
jgi:serine/threonine-protein kinase